MKIHYLLYEVKLPWKIIVVPLLHGHFNGRTKGKKDLKGAETFFIRELSMIKIAVRYLITSWIVLYLRL